ncbi:hypothetical protein acsn021_12360 [Anaerocolumna cellulosilytica]|uniref:Uncharacterized protein n=1 Tax=Anaerocolumna cellulosilytica TaxID=433286 RepID=A0A6S6R0T1_9FIRM|nr:hypothetical protein [Anaerocolumna cellulosilytica]MBB5196030.1 hypothetical protein [Anaerocolumna cellulosilytica]BCJ93667.1 hypothetical protein acsn021_12360 [Anaerocolumna cellulosilytica]
MQDNYSASERMIYMVKWLAEHPKIQSRLCEDYAETTLEECLSIIELLEKNGLYEMIVVLLLKNQYKLEFEQIVTEFVIEKMLKEWERVGIEQMCYDIKGKIKEKIKQKD